MALFIFSINLPRVSTRGYNMFRADGPLNILSPQGLCRGPCDGLQLYINGARSRAYPARGAGFLSGDPAFVKFSVAAGSLAEDPAMVCSYIQMEHNPTHTWHAAQGPFQETLGTGNPT